MKKIIFLFLLIASLGFGQSTIQNHVLYSKSGAKYEGKIKKGTTESGSGIFRVKEKGSSEKGNKYVGEFSGTNFNGIGTMTIIPSKMEVDKELSKLNNLPPTSFKRTTKETAIYLKRHKYKGEWKNGHKHGNGIQTWINGDIYEGQFIDDNFSNGRKTWANGDVYEGEWKNAKMHGIGKFVKANGEIKKGEFVLNNLLVAGNCAGNCINGYGTFLWISGDRYDGNWKNRKQHGEGTLTWKNGDKYVGKYLDGYRHGQGNYYWKSGSIYVGEFVKNKRTGQGTYTWVNGNIYIGNFKDSKEHGKGTFIYNDGKKCEGEWSYGKKLPEADYTITNTDGSTSYEFYRNNKLIGTTLEELQAYENEIAIKSQKRLIEYKKKQQEYLKIEREKKEKERIRIDKIKKETAYDYCNMSKQSAINFIEKGLRSWNYEGARLSFLNFGNKQVHISSYPTRYGKATYYGNYTVNSNNRIYIFDLHAEGGNFDASTNNPSRGYAKIKCNGDIEFQNVVWELNR